MQNVSMLSNGRLKLAPGTLYGAINSLVEKKWIIALNEGSNQRKKEYQITKEGIEVLKIEVLRLEELLSNGKNIMGEDE